MPARGKRYSDAEKARYYARRAGLKVSGRVSARVSGARRLVASGSASAARASAAVAFAKKFVRFKWNPAAGGYTRASPRSVYEAALAEGGSDFARQVERAYERLTDRK